MSRSFNFKVKQHNKREREGVATLLKSPLGKTARAASDHLLLVKSRKKGNYNAMISASENLANVARPTTVAHQAEHQTLSGGTSFTDVLRGLFGPDLCDVETTAESRRTSPTTLNDIAPQPHNWTTPASPNVASDPVAVPLPVPPQPQPNTHPAPQPAPGLVVMEQPGYIHGPLHQHQPFSAYSQLGQLGPPHQHPPQQQAAPPPYMYQLQQRQPPPNHHWRPPTPRQDVLFSPLPVLRLQQQQPSAQQPPQQQHQQTGVPPRDGAPSEAWLRETSSLLSRPEGDAKDSGLRHLGGMMLGLSTHLDAQGYELPTAFPEPPDDILRPPGPISYLLVTRGKATNSRQNSGV